MPADSLFTRLVPRSRPGVEFGSADGNVSSEGEQKCRGSRVWQMSLDGSETELVSSLLFSGVVRLKESLF